MACDVYLHIATLIDANLAFGVWQFVLARARGQVLE